MNSPSSVCVFCGARSGQDAKWAKVAQELGQILAQNKSRLVYGGGHAGLMGTLADSALQAGGAVVGVIPEDLQVQELAHQGLTQLHVVKTMHQRKALMESLSDAFIAIPGGFGTMDEFFEILTWRQLGIHNKPVALLNSHGFFDSWLEFCQKTVAEGFVSADDLEGIIVETDPTALWNRLESID